MKKVLCVFAMLGLVACANASVQIFFDTANPWDGPGPVGGPFDPTGDNGLDYTQDGYVVNNFPAAFNPTVTLPQPTPDPIYVWLKFNNEPLNRKIIGIHLVQDGADPTDIAYYVADDTNGEGFKRWDGAYTPPLDPEFKKLNQVLVAVTAYGIQNRSGDVAWNMYKGGTYRTALLGVIQANAPGTYRFKLGTLGIAYSTGDPPVVEFGELVVLPEPASFLLLGLAALIRRR